MGLRVKDRGGSEGRRVRDRIGVARSPRAKASRLPRSVSGREPSANRRRGQCRTVGGIVTILAGAASATSVVGTVVVTPRWTPRPMGPTACLPKARCLRLEPYALKGACTVLRGGGEDNLTSLPDPLPQT